MLPKFNSLFAEHAFFLDGKDLNIIEPVASPEDDPAQAQVVKLARWGNESHASLVHHRPGSADVVVILGKAA